MLSGLDCRETNGHVTLRDREIQNNVNRRIRQNRFDACRLYPEFSRPYLGILWNDISTGDDLKLGKSGLQVRGTDVTCADDTHLLGLVLKHFRKRFQRLRSQS